MEELFHFDLHEMLKTPRMDAIPHMMGIGPQSICVKGIEDTAFARTLIDTRG
jgi:hypothetical protein